MTGKRPLGLGKASKEKKKAKADKSESPEAITEKPEIEIELGDDADGDEEIAEVYGLYSQLKKDRASSKLARALVHECDALVRSRPEVPSQVLIAYGAALFTLAALGDTKESPDEFRNFAFERIEEGTEDSTLALAALEYLKHAQAVVSVEPTSDETKSLVRKLLKKALELLRLNPKNQIDALAEADVAFMELAEFSGLEDEYGDLAVEFANLAHRQLKEIKEEVPENSEAWRLAHKGIGLYHLSQVAQYLDLNEEDEDDEDEDEDELPAAAKRDLRIATEHLSLALSESDPQLYVTYAETLLPYADTLEREPREKAYKQAIKHLRKAQILGVENLHGVIDSVEESLN